MAYSRIFETSDVMFGPPGNQIKGLVMAYSLKAQAESKLKNN